MSRVAATDGAIAVYVACAALEAATLGRPDRMARYRRQVDELVAQRQALPDWELAKADSRADITRAAWLVHLTIDHMCR